MSLTFSLLVVCHSAGVASRADLDRPVRPDRRIAEKTPPTSVAFWAMTLTVSTVGEAAGTFLATAPPVVLVATSAWFSTAAAFHLRARRLLLWLYWAAVLLAAASARLLVEHLGVVWAVPGALVLLALRHFWSTTAAVLALGSATGSVLLYLDGGLAALLCMGMLTLVIVTRLVSRRAAFWVCHLVVQPLGLELVHLLDPVIGSTDTIEFFALSALTLAAYQAGTHD
jgi:uncharacterized membrane-anchored protein